MTWERLLRMYAGWEIVRFGGESAGEDQVVTIVLRRAK